MQNGLQRNERWRLNSRACTPAAAEWLRVYLRVDIDSLQEEAVHTGCPDRVCKGNLVQGQQLRQPASQRGCKGGPLRQRLVTQLLQGLQQQQKINDNSGS